MGRHFYGELIVQRGDNKCPRFCIKKSGMEFSSIPESVYPLIFYSNGARLVGISFPVFVL